MGDTLEARLALLGRHVAFMGEMTHKTVNEKYLLNLKKDHNIKKYCLKVARILEGVVKNSVCYAKDLCNLVSESRQKEDLSEVTKLLETIVSFDENLISTKTEETEYKPEEASPKRETEETEAQSDSDCETVQEKNNKKDKKKRKSLRETNCGSESRQLTVPEHQIEQDSVHIDPLSCKPETQSDDYLSDNSETTVAARNETDRSVEFNELVPNPLNETFRSDSTVQAPSAKREKRNKKRCPSSGESDSDLDNEPSTKRIERNEKSEKDKDACSKDKKGEKEKESGGKKDTGKRSVEKSDEPLKEPAIADSQATCLDSQDLAEICDIEDIKSGQNSRRNSTESFVFDMSDYNITEQGTKKDKGSEHISEFDTPSPSDHGSEHNIGDHQSDSGTIIEDSQIETAVYDTVKKEITEPSKEQKEKVIRKSLLKVIDQYFKKKKTQRKRRTPKVKVKKNTDMGVPNDMSVDDKENLKVGHHLYVDLSKSIIHEIPPNEEVDDSSEEQENDEEMITSAEKTEISGGNGDKIENQSSGSEDVSATDEERKNDEKMNTSAGKTEISRGNGDKIENQSSESENVNLTDEEQNNHGTMEEFAEKTTDHIIEIQSSPTEQMKNTKTPQNDSESNQDKVLNQDIDPQESKTSDSDTEDSEESSKPKTAEDSVVDIQTNDNESESTSESASDGEISSPVALEHSYQKNALKKRKKKVKNAAKQPEEENTTVEKTTDSQIDHTFQKRPKDTSTETDSDNETQPAESSASTVTSPTISVVEILDSTDCDKGKEYIASSDVESLKLVDKVDVLSSPATAQTSDQESEENRNTRQDLNSSDSSATVLYNEVPLAETDIAAEAVVSYPEESEGETVLEQVVNCEENLTEKEIEVKSKDPEEKEIENESEGSSKACVVSDGGSKSKSGFNNKISGVSDLESSGEEENIKKESENDADSESSCVAPVTKKLIRLSSTEEDPRESITSRRKSQRGSTDLREEESPHIPGTNNKNNEKDSLDMLREDLDLTQITDDENVTSKKLGSTELREEESSVAAINEKNDEKDSVDMIREDLELTQITDDDSQKENQTALNDNNGKDGQNQDNTEPSSSSTVEYPISLKDIQEQTNLELEKSSEQEDLGVQEGAEKASERVEGAHADAQDTDISDLEVAESKKRKRSDNLDTSRCSESDKTPLKNAKLNKSLENKDDDNPENSKHDELSTDSNPEVPKDLGRREDDETNVDDDLEKRNDDETSVSEDENDDETETEGFKLDDRERDELLDLLDEHFKSIKHEGLEKCDETQETEEIISQAHSEGMEINRELLMKLLQEYEDAVATGKDLELEEEKLKEEEADADIGDIEKQTEDAQVEDADVQENAEIDAEREGSKTPEPLLQLVKEEEFIQHTPGKKGRKKTELRHATEIYKKLMEEDSDLDSSSTTSMSSSPTKSLDSDLSADTENAVKKTHFKVTKELLERHGVDKKLVVNLERGDFGDVDLNELPKSAKEAVTIERLCDLTNVLQQRKRNASGSDPETPKRRGKKRRDTSRSRSTPTSPFLSSDDESDSSSRPHSRSDGGHSPVNFHSDDSQEAMARAFMDRMKGDSSDDNSPIGGEDSASDLDEKKKKKAKSSLEEGETEPGKEGDKKKSEGEAGGEGEESAEERSGDEQRKKAPKAELTTEEKRKKRWKRDPLLHGRMLSSGASSSDSDTDASAGSDASERRRKRTDKLKSKYDIKSTDSDSKKPDSDNKNNSDSDSEDILFKKSPIKNKIPLESDSDSSSVEFVSTKMKTPPKIKRKKDSSDTETEDDVIEVESPSKGKGRRNIRELLDDEALAVDTKKANEEEKKRIKRLEERKSQRETFSQSQSFGSQDAEEDALVLDIDKKTLEVLIKVHPKISRRLKPHQRDGIQFMWDSCYESCDQMKKGWQGSGCILAHCMGLGKTLQVLGLVHTIFNYSEVTKCKNVLVVCPLSTVSNWRNEYKLAYKNIENCDVNIFTIEDRKTNDMKFDIVKRWKRRGGILVMGYEAFGNLINENKLEKWEKQRLCSKEAVLEALVDPGPDLVVCDEGHLLKNKQTNRNISLNKVKTKRRIVLTGTPLQNNLIEYYCMVNFVKPNLLGNEREYKTNFVNPITNGQYEDSNSMDIKLMKCRTHVLYKILKGTVQRVEDTELKKYLPKLVDYALFLQVSDMQIDFYHTYLDLAVEGLEYNQEGNLCQKNFLADVVMVKYICSHPYVLSVVDRKDKKKIKEQDVIDDNNEDQVPSTVSTNKWWRNMLPEDASERLELGHKIMLAIAIIEEAEALGEKVLIFSQNYGEMDVLEHFLSTKGTKVCPRWQKRLDYYRMDGTIIPEERAIMCDKFNNPKNKKLRVFIMSTKVGGLGLNLTAASRIIIMNVNWNPSYDTQSVFRAYRFGQDKAVFVYRLISMQTMEEKIYQRSVTKLAVAHRVVDKHQIKRAYSKADIEEMYGVRPTKDAERPVPNYPEDDELLAKLLQKHKFIHRWHEHQGLLANRPEEDLDDQEKEAAWEEFNRKQEAPPAPTAFGPGMMPNMGAMAAMNLLNAYGGNVNNAELMNMINSFIPKYTDEHSYSLPTNTNVAGPSTSGIQPNNLPTPTQNFQPRALLNQPPNNPQTATPTPKFNTHFTNQMKNAMRNLVNTNQVNGVRLPPVVDGGNKPTMPTVTNVTGSNNAGNTVAKNWLMSQMPNIGPDQPLRFALKSNFTNEQGLRGITWPGVRVHSRGGLIHYSYIPPSLPPNMYMAWAPQIVKAPDGSNVTVFTQRDNPARVVQPPTANAVPSTKAGQTTVTSNVQPPLIPFTSAQGIPGAAPPPVNSTGLGYTKIPPKQLISPTSNIIKGVVVKKTGTGREFIPVRTTQLALSTTASIPNITGPVTRKVAPPPSMNTTTPAGLRLVPTSTLTGQKTPAASSATSMGNQPIKPVPANQSSTETKLVVPNPFSRGAHLIKSNSVPVIKRVGGMQSANNSVKAAGLTGTKQVVPNPLSSQVKLAGSVSVKPSVAPPPAHTGVAVASPTVARPPRLVNHRKSLEKLSPRNAVDLSMPRFSKTTPQNTATSKTSATPSNRSQNLLKSPPNQNFNSNLKTAISNSTRNSPRNSTNTVNSPKSNTLGNSPGNSPNSRLMSTNSPKSGTSTGNSGPKFVTSRDISNGRSPGGGKRGYDTKNSGGSPVPTKKIIISQNDPPNHSISAALPALTPRPTVAPIINMSTENIYKEMLRNLQGGTSFGNKATPMRSKLQTNPPRATPPTTPSTSQPISNKENRRNRLQLNREPSSAFIDLDDDGNVTSDASVNQHTLEKLKEKGVSVNMVDKKDPDIIDLD